ncbi:hypothetical protein BD289DRAFT_433558 [Coniella lustricola]|uniref:S-adenosyl-L-methionine-dependent methyltransferase n=1 Tax=Coniella lustricola TaxID=2025994 RepID=A0A2T3A8J1_9PEZI|nr:hypothetical protein BD289DRAFT_433558 [Coniella lustricola]
MAASCTGSSSWDPAACIRDADAAARVAALLSRDDFAGAIKTYFNLPSNDSYAYHAITTVTLPQVQHVISLGGSNGLHAWYAPLPGSSSSDTPASLPSPPPPHDIEAYTTLFSHSTLTSAALTALASNAKKSSIRARVAAYLDSTRYIHPGAASILHIPKKKPAAKDVPLNPYFTFWAWSCRNLEWCGPCPESEARPQSHHILPVLMHHFGCAIPSYESLEILRLVARGRVVADMGSGNGYWAFMLRQHGLTVAPVDNAQSRWRANWVADTTIMDGAKWLAKNAGGQDVVLLMVYPVVGGTVGGGVDGGFTRDLIKAYKGDTIAVVGTQNHNGYTSFGKMTFAEYMAKEQPEWTRMVQIPIPSFAGKDEALFVYQRGESVAQLGPGGRI